MQIQRLLAAAAAGTVLTLMLAGCSSQSTSGPSAGSGGASSPATSSSPESITVTSTNPYYLMQVTYQGEQVQSGSKVAGCIIASYSKCPGADLSGQSLQGAFLSYSQFPQANISKANLKVGSIAFADFAKVTGTDVDLSGTSLVRTNLSGADLTRAKRIVLPMAVAEAVSEHSRCGLLVCVCEPSGRVPEERNSSRWRLLGCGHEWR